MRRKIAMIMLPCLVAAVLCSCGGKRGQTVEEATESKASGTEFKEQETQVPLAVEIETETETEGPEVKTITITATGDCTLGKTQDQGYGNSFCGYYDNNGEEYFFANVKKIFQEDDFTLINLECVLTEETTRVEKAFNLKGNPEYTGIMTSSSIEGCSTGNNHCMDYGEKSQTDTQEALDSAGIEWAYNEKIGTYTTEDGLVIGFVSASLLSSPDSRLQIMKDGIKKLQEDGADLIVACCHWGIEREYYPYEVQTSSARALIDEGADLVVGNHPHVLQGIELYNGKVICYSLGNFCFGGNLNPSDKDTMIFQQTFTYVDGELQADVNAHIIPCTLSGHTGYNDFQPTIATGDKWQKILDNVNKYSEPYSKIHFDGEGNLVVDEVSQDEANQ